MIIRAQRQDHFTVINNTAINDDRLGFRAKGVLIYILSKPDHWSVSERSLAQIGPDGRDAVATALKELATCGYLRRTKTRNADGTFSWDSMIFDVPQAVAVEAPESPVQTEIPPVNEAEELPEVAEMTMNGFSGHGATMNGFSSHGLTVHGKAGHIVNTDQVNTNNLPPPNACAHEAVPVQAATVHKQGSPYMTGLLLPGGHVPDGEGANGVQVYYERFHYSDPDAHLTRPKEDDLIRLCPDLDRLREVVTEYSRTGYRAGNVKLILDWYRDGVPVRQANDRGRYGNGKAGGNGINGVTGGRNGADSRKPWADYRDPQWTDDEFEKYGALLAGRAQ